MLIMLAFARAAHLALHRVIVKHQLLLHVHLLERIAGSCGQIVLQEWHVARLARHRLRIVTLARNVNRIAQLG